MSRVSLIICVSSDILTLTFIHLSGQQALRFTYGVYFNYVYFRKIDLKIMQSTRLPTLWTRDSRGFRKSIFTFNSSLVIEVKLSKYSLHVYYTADSLHPETISQLYGFIKYQFTVAQNPALVWNPLEFQGKKHQENAIFIGVLFTKAAF